jgi:hypothetical protein
MDVPGRGIARWSPELHFIDGVERSLDVDCAIRCNVCRDVAYRQALRDLERCTTWEGIIPRRRRKSFARLWEHNDPRILAVAKGMQEEDRMARRLMRAEAERDGGRVRSEPAVRD